MASGVGIGTPLRRASAPARCAPADDDAPDVDALEDTGGVAVEDTGGVVSSAAGVVDVDAGGAAAAVAAAVDGSAAAEAAAVCEAVSELSGLALAELDGDPLEPELLPDPGEVAPADEPAAPFAPLGPVASSWPPGGVAASASMTSVDGGGAGSLGWSLDSELPGAWSSPEVVGALAGGVVASTWPAAGAAAAGTPFAIAPVAGINDEAASTPAARPACAAEESSAGDGNGPDSRASQHCTQSRRKPRRACSTGSGVRRCVRSVIELLDWSCA